MGIVKNFFDNLKGIFRNKNGKKNLVKEPPKQVQLKPIKQTSMSIADKAMQEKKILSSETGVLKPFENKQSEIKLLENKLVGNKSDPKKKEAPKTVSKAEKKEKSPGVSKKNSQAAVGVGAVEYRRTIKKLRNQIQDLRKEIEKKQLSPKKALGGIQVIYNEIKHEARDIDKEIKQNKNLMNYLEKDFLRRKVSEKMFREKMFEYQEKSHILAMEKKELKKQKSHLRYASKKVPSPTPFTLEQLSKVSNVEELLKKQQETLEKIVSQNSSKTTANQSSGTVPVSSTNAQVSSAKPQESMKANEPAKPGNVNMSGGQTVQPAVQSAGGAKSTSTKTPQPTSGQEAEQIITAMRFTSPMKIRKEEKAIPTEIKKYRIVTDFDKVYSFVLKEGKVKTSQIVKGTGLQKKRAEECAELLRKENKVKIIYPPIGDAVVQTLDYEEKMVAEKLKKKEQQLNEKKKSKVKK